MLTSSALDAVNDFLRHAADRDLPDVDLFELKAHAFDLMAEQVAEDVDAAECRHIADGARAVAAALAGPDACEGCGASIVLPADWPDGWPPACAECQARRVDELERLLAVHPAGR